MHRGKLLQHTAEKALKKKREIEAAEHKIKLENAAAERRRLENAAAEQKRLENEAAERRKLEKAVAERHRLENEEAQRRKLENAAAELKKLEERMKNLTISTHIDSMDQEKERGIPILETFPDKEIIDSTSTLKINTQLSSKTKLQVLNEEKIAENKQVMAADDYTEITREFLNNLKNETPTLTERLHYLNLSVEEEESIPKFQDPVHLTTVEIPVRFNGNLFNLQTLLDNLGKPDPLSNEYLITKNQIQPDWDTASELKNVLIAIENKRNQKPVECSISPPGGIKI